jgi:transmembrane sensor
MLQAEERARSEAIDWVIRLRDPATADWAGFTAWLEADPANNPAYEAVALADSDMVDLVGVAPPVVASPSSNDNQPISRPRRMLLGWGAAAAALLAGVVAMPLLQRDAGERVVQTAAGERQSVTLDDGTRIDLNGDTRMVLTKQDDRLAQLDRGEATFTVVHDASNPFVVKVGDSRFQDVGTVFNVVRADNITRVEVAQGLVLYNPDKEAVTLKPGQSLHIADGEPVAQVGNVDLAAVASWRDRRLVYRNMPLSGVASDLSRNLGLTVKAAPDIAARPFSGVILLNGNRTEIKTRLAALLDVSVVDAGNASWRLASRGRAGS